MRDIRRLNLEDRTLDSVVSVKPEQYMLGQERLTRLERVLLEMNQLDYWHPQYQAWEPFVMAYLTAGVNPPLAQRWLPALQKKIPDLGPDDGKYTEIFKELLSMSRTSGTEVFKDTTYESLMEFSEWSLFFIEHEKEIYKTLLNAKNWCEQFDSYVQQGANGYSEAFIYAVYMYRHCMLMDNPAPKSMRDELQRQIGVYSEMFGATFDNVSCFPESTDGVYQWYTGKVRNLIVNAWQTSLDLTSKRHVISASDVFAMEVWLSEQITAYLNTLPCVTTVQPDGVFVFNALSNVVSKEFTKESTSNTWAYCIPQTYIKNMITLMIDFYWDIREGRLTQYMQDRMSVRYTELGGVDTPSPEEYKRDLLSRGFPVR